VLPIGKPGLGDRRPQPLDARVIRVNLPRGTTPRPRWSRAVGLWRFSINLKDTKMNWDHIEKNWKQFKGNVKEQWGKLTDDQLDEIAGMRAPLTRKIQETYGVSKDEAEKQLADFQERIKEIGHVKSDKGADATLRGAQ